MTFIKPPPSMTFPRFAEKVNGRAAMQGTFWATKGFIQTHHGVISQLSDPRNDLMLASVLGVVTLGTAITAGWLEKEVPKFDSTIWTDEVEDINGRVAMISFPFLALAYESLEILLE